MRGLCRASISVRNACAIQLQRASPRQLNHRAAAAGPGRQLAATAAARQRMQVCARWSDRDDYYADRDYVEFDDEENWEQQGTPVQMGLAPVLSTALRGLGAIADRLTDVALQYAPADASPGVVRIAVSAGLVLLALSFVKSILSFFLTMGTIILGAYVAVQVFGLDISGGGGGGSSGGPRGGASRRQKPRQRQERRRIDPRARQSEFKGLLSSFSGADDDGLLDVRFERRTGSGGSNGAKGRRQS